MREYENTAKEKYRTGIDPDVNHTVRQLESLVAEALKEHQEMDSDGVWGKINQACKALGNGKDDVDSWLGLLPTECEYLSVVCGGMKLIVKV